VIAPGDLIGDALVVEGAVGRGGTAVVYRARRVDTGERVALKLLIGGPLDRARIERERALLADVDDPRLVRVLELGTTDDDVAYAVLPWIDGQSLDARAVEPGVTAAEAMAVIAAAADALAVAHARGVVHRDLKPAHLWQRPDGAIAILDFGIARGPDDARLTHSGTAIGTPGYMAPEQLLGEAIAPATDVFALGCIAYELLTGAPTFSGSHPAVLRGKVLWTEPPPLDAHCPEAPPALVTLVAAMLAKDPARRPADGAAVAAAFAMLPPIPVGPRRRRGHGELATAPSTVPHWIAVGVPRGASAAPAAAPATTLADHSAIARVPADATLDADTSAATRDAAALAALVAALGSDRAIAIARTDDTAHGLRWCADAATAAAAAGELAPVVQDLLRSTR